MFSAFDERMMRQALELAALGRHTTPPNPCVGCVVVQGEKIVGEGWHRKWGEPHAEPLALHAAGSLARGATVYVTLEPHSYQSRTPPCTEALIRAGVRRVVSAVLDANPKVSGDGVRQLQAAGIQADVGLLANEARELNLGFEKRMQTGLPRVVVKSAISLDGRIALANGESKWITGEAARADVQKLRSRMSAIVTGVGTVIADDPQLNVRDASIEMLGRQPLRVVLDSKLRMSPSARILKQPGETLIVGGVTPPRNISYDVAPGTESGPFPNERISGPEDDLFPNGRASSHEDGSLHRSRASGAENDSFPNGRVSGPEDGSLHGSGEPVGESGSSPTGQQTFSRATNSAAAKEYSSAAFKSAASSAVENPIHAERANGIAISPNAKAAFGAAEQLRAAGAEVISVELDDSGRIDLHSVLRELGRRMCNDVLIEAGPTLVGRVLELGLADEIVVYIAPVLLGPDARPMANLPALGQLASAQRYTLHSHDRIGDDVRLVLRRPG